MCTKTHLRFIGFASIALFACGDSSEGSGPVEPAADTSSPTPETSVGDDTTSLADTAEAPTVECTDDQGCAVFADRPLCNVAAGVCEALPPGHLIGWRDGSAGSVDLTLIHQPRNSIESTDLEFHPERDELWVVNRNFHVGGLCVESNPFSPRCRSYRSTVTIIFAPGAPEQRVETREDENSFHFMRRVPAMAMGAHDTWATCGEAATGNFDDDPTTYIGPTLWSSDLDVFARPSGANGSHLDMLHETPWCVGIAHERDNVYWLFNGEVGSIDRVDFHEDHGPGNDDHSDGEVHRYIEGFLTRVPHVPSHLEFDHRDDMLYVVDTGAARVIKLDTTTGTYGGPLHPVWEELAAHGVMDDAVGDIVVGSGTLDLPSGIALHDDVIYVSDHATSRLYAFDHGGRLLRELDTGLPEGTLAGITVGPDDRLYFVDMRLGSVYRLDPR